MHNIIYLDYRSSSSKKKIMKNIERIVSKTGDAPYHYNLKFHKDIVCKNREEAKKKIEHLDNGWYDDHAVFYKDGRKKFWLVKIEYHCQFKESKCNIRLLSFY